MQGDIKGGLLDNVSTAKTVGADCTCLDTLATLQQFSVKTDTKKKLKPVVYSNAAKRCLVDGSCATVLLI